MDNFSSQQSTDEAASGQLPVPPPTQGSNEELPEPLQSGQHPDLQQGNQQRFHVHHTYIWLGSIQVAISIFIVSIFAGIPILLSERTPVIGQSGLGIILLPILFLIILGVVFGLMYLSWKNLYFELGEKEFSLYSGILNKKKVHVPYQRVQSVNQKATLIQRILGVCSVHIDTAGGSTNKAVSVPYLQKSMAEWLRSEIFMRKQFILSGQENTSGQVLSPDQSASPATNVLDGPAGVINESRGVFGGTTIDTGAVSYEYGLSNKELIFTGLSNNTGAVLLIVAAIGSIIGIAGNVMMTNIGQYVYDQGVAIVTSAFADRLIWVGVGLVIGFIAVVWVLSVIGACISYGGFKAVRRGSRIEVEQGLLQHHFHGVDIDRVQSVIVKQSFVRRLMGYCELSLGKIDAVEAGAQTDDRQLQLSQGLIVHPFVKMNRVPELLAGLTPEFADVPTEQIKLPKVSQRRALIRRVIVQGGGFWLAIFVRIFQEFANNFGPLIDENFAQIQGYINLGALSLYIVCALLVILSFIGALMWFKDSSFAYNKNFMQITNGGFSRESITFPRKKIQYGFTRTNPFQRFSRVATINARTAAGVGGTTMSLLDVDEEAADKWLNWVKPGNNMVQ